MRRIPVAAPALVGNEKVYVQDCLDSEWISSQGAYIERFESEFARFCDTDEAVACVNGTAALHLALAALDVSAGDEVIVPTLTFVATANAVTYCGATPVFADSDPETWTLDPEQLERLITPRTRGIVVVHLYGHPTDMDPVLEVARRHGLFVVEDAAEAHGAGYRGRTVGSIGDVGVFSFYGNKILSTGEGGMVVTDDPGLADRLRLLRGQGMDPDRRYWFPVVGYNYRMTNLAAAIGLAQVERAGWHLERRREIAAGYAERLSAVEGVRLQPEASWAHHAYWMVTVLIEGGEARRDRVMARMAEDGIETRPVFYPMHTLPPYRQGAGRFPVAERLAASGINLPTWAGLDADDVQRVCDVLETAIQTEASRDPLLASG